MLKPAILYKEELNRLMALATMERENMFFHAGEDIALTMDVKDTTWGQHQFVSVAEGQEVLGYISASIDRNARFVRQIGLIAFKKNRFIFMRDFQRFIWRMLVHHNYTKIKWSVTCGSPHEATYDKLCKRYGGRIVGIFEDENRLEDGQLYNEKWYEIKNSKLVAKALPVIVKLHDNGINIPEYSGKEK